MKPDTKHAWLIGAALFVAGLVALSVWPASRVSIDNRIERWLDTEGEEAERYEHFRALFGTDEFVLAAYDGQPFFGAAQLDAQLDALGGLESVNHVRRVLGIPAVYRDLFGLRDADALEAFFKTTPAFKNFLIDESGTMAGLLIETEAPEDAAGRRQLVRHIENALVPLREAGFSVHMVGPPVLNAVLDQTSELESRRVFPPALACSVLVLLILFWSLRATLVAVACAGMTITLTMAVLVLSGRTLNMVTAAMPSLLWVLSLSNIIHVIRRYQVHHVTRGPREAIWAALRDTAKPCALAAVTTALGFLSLTVASMEPVRELGVFAAVGILIALIVNLSVGPALILLLRVPGPRRGTNRLESALSFVHSRASRRPGVILGISVALAASAVFSLARIRVESNPLAFLEPDSPAVQSYDVVCGTLTGAYTLEIVIETPGGWNTPACRDALNAVTRALKNQPGVARVISPLDGLGQNNAFAPGSLSRLVAEDGNTVRLSVLVSAMDSGRFLAILDEAKQALAQLPPPLRGYHTGIVPRLVDAQLDLVQTQLRSFGLAFLIVFLCILIGLRSFKLMLVSIAPNVLPIASAFAAMAWAGVALDAGTVMVASVALGIAVDDTVHLLSAFREALRRGHGKAQASAEALAHAGPAMIITTATACAGFFALGRSAFVPIQYFGLLSGLAMLAALAADLLLAPALLMLLPWRTSNP